MATHLYNFKDKLSSQIKPKLSLIVVYLYQTIDNMLLSDLKTWIRLHSNFLRDQFEPLNLHTS